jgi:Glycosyl hydrolase family 3 N terminal domain
MSPYRLQPTPAQQAVLRVILRQQMHFQGVIVSDDLGAATAVAGLSPGVRGIDFLAAGGDLVTSQSLPAAAEMDSAILARVTADAALSRPGELGRSPDTPCQAGISPAALPATMSFGRPHRGRRPGADHQLRALRTRQVYDVGSVRL